jgi:hypothetical protein
MVKCRRPVSAWLARWSVMGCLLAATVIPAAGAEKITLGLHLKAGQTFHMVTTIESNLTQTIMGQEMVATSTNGMGYTYEIQQVADDGTATCKVTYNSVQVKMSMGGFDMQYDSTKPAAGSSPMIKPFTALVGQSFSMRISPAGRVTDVQGVEAIYEKMLKDLELPDESMRGMVEQQVKEQFGAESIRETMEQMIGVGTPDGGVDVGDSWVRRASMARPYPMSLESKFTLKERKDGTAFIDVVSKIGPNPAVKPMQVGPMTMTYGFTGERKGLLEIEEATGWIVGAKHTQQMSGTINAEGGPQGPMSIPISGTITTRIESKK